MARRKANVACKSPCGCQRSANRGARDSHRTRKAPGSLRRGACIHCGLGAASVDSFGDAPPFRPLCFAPHSSRKQRARQTHANMCATKFGARPPPASPAAWSCIGHPRFPTAIDPTSLSRPPSARTYPPDNPRSKSATVRFRHGEAGEWLLQFLESYSRPGL